jgi:hypothetical protein
LNRGWTVALILAGLFAVGRTLTWLADTPAPVHQATPAKAVSKDPEVIECDKEVAILLQSRDMADLMRAGFIIQRLNCDIGKRL